jgi:hypothetical protein
LARGAVNNRYARARYVLACRCGRALSPADMCWQPPRLGDTRLVRPIVCPRCVDTRPAARRHQY